MPNKVFLREDKIVQQILNKNLCAADLADDLKMLLKLQEQLKRESLPLKILLDSSSISHADTATRKQGVHNLEQMNYKKIAIFGPTIYLRYLINFVLFATGKKKVHIFDSEEEAIEWLNKP